MKTLVTIAMLLLPGVWVMAQSEPSIMDSTILIGTWELDMTPQDQTDSNFATMKIDKVDGNTFYGEFYREGVKITHANINTQTGSIIGALVSSDGTGNYNSTFSYKDGILYGTTHALERNFLAVWTGKKIK